MAKCFGCGAEFGGTSALTGVLCPACRLLDQQREAERRHIAEERERREEERERREEERERREEERERRELEERRFEEERARRSSEEARREKEQKDAAAAALFRSSKPHCKWCGNSYVFENGHGFGEYCCRRCAKEDLKGGLDKYGSRLDEVLGGKVRAQLEQDRPVTAALYAAGMEDIPFGLLSDLIGELEALELRREDIDVLYRKLNARFEKEKTKAALRRLEEEEERLKREFGDAFLSLPTAKGASAPPPGSAPDARASEPTVHDGVYTNCPFCHRSVKADASWEGQKGECPYCGKTFTIKLDLSKDR